MWEYRVYKMDVGVVETSSFEEVLNSMAKDGWEFYGIVDYPTNQGLCGLLFRRQK